MSFERVLFDLDLKCGRDGELTRDLVSCSSSQSPLMF